MRPFTTGSDYVNQLALETDDGSERIRAAYGANYERLVAVKNEYDPTYLFRPNHIRCHPRPPRPSERRVNYSGAAGHMRATGSSVCWRDAARE
jgi:berberine-like enzyme